MYPATTSRRFTAMIICLMVFTMLAAASAAAEARRMAVSVDVANTRSGPGSEHEKLWQMEIYTPLEVLETQGDWCFFEDFEGTRAWIHKDLVADTKTVITKKGVINIRTGPGTSNDVAFQAEKGVPFKVLEKKGDWIHIQHADGEKGWIYSGLVW